MKLITTNNPTAEKELSTLPAGFLIQKTTAGDGQSLKPLSRVAFRKAHGLTNAESKRQYAAHLKRFTLACLSDMQAQVLNGKLATGVSVSKSGVRHYKIADIDLPVVATPAPVTPQAAVNLLGDKLKALGLTAEQLATLV